MPTAFLALLLVLPLGLPNRDAAPSPALGCAADETMLASVTNAERGSRGLPPLHLDSRLSALARDHADDMAQRHYFDHDSPEHESPFDRLERAHYDYSYAGENLALGRDANDAAQTLWTSPEHRANTLESHYRRVGIGAAQTAAGEIFVIDFSD